MPQGICRSEWERVPQDYLQRSLKVSYLFLFSSLPGHAGLIYLSARNSRGTSPSRKQTYKCYLVPTSKSNLRVQIYVGGGATHYEMRTSPHHDKSLVTYYGEGGGLQNWKGDYPVFRGGGGVNSFGPAIFPFCSPPPFP